MIVRGTCALDIEWSADSLHAHAVPIDVAIAPGDRVTIHDAPRVAPGDHYIAERPITVERAGALRRAWTRAASVFALTELFEVGFEPAGHAS